MTQTNNNKETTDAKKSQSRGVATRARILAVTKQLISDHDFHSVTLDQISSESKVAKSSLLWHFSNKELLLTEAASDLFTDLERSLILIRNDSHNLEQRKEIFLDAIGEYFDQNPESKGVLISLVFNSQLPQKIHDRINEHWTHNIETIEHYFSLPDKAFPIKTAKVILASIHGCYLHWYLHQHKRSFGEVLREHFECISID